MSRAAGLATRLRALSSQRRWAVLASLVWVVVVCSYAAGFLAVATGGQERGTLLIDGLFFLLTLVLPLMLVWLAAYLAEELVRQREAVAAFADRIAPLATSLDETRRLLEKHGPVAPGELAQSLERALAAARHPDPAPQLAQIMDAQVALYAALQEMSAPPAAAEPPPAAAPAPSPRDARPAPAPASAPQDLPLLPDAAAETGPHWQDLIRALDFPRDGNDHEGFRALKAALRRHSLAQMLQAAEDVLNLLSEEGVFVDELEIVSFDAADWRRFMNGTRGAAVGGMGGIRDARALATARELVKSDPIFRDTALFFQRRFDVVLSEFGRTASDDELAELANTRSGRAFMLMARLSGSFG